MFDPGNFLRCIASYHENRNWSKKKKRKRKMRDKKRKERKQCVEVGSVQMHIDLSPKLSGRMSSDKYFSSAGIESPIEFLWKLAILRQMERNGFDRNTTTTTATLYLRVSISIFCFHIIYLCMRTQLNESTNESNDWWQWASEWVMSTTTKQVVIQIWKSLLIWMHAIKRY